MKTIRHAADRGNAEFGWLSSRHSFSFGSYYDPAHMGFRSLRVINDDRVAAGQGFGTHPHRDMEIISYVLSGALEHRDSMGNGRVIRPGEFQYMAAGTGVTHSEFNPSGTDPVHFLQIWIVPEKKGLKPAYGERRIEAGPTGGLKLVLSGDGREGSMRLNQDVEVYLGRFEGGEAVRHEIRAGRGVWVQVAEGSVVVNGELLQVGDGMALEQEPALELVGKGTSQVIVFDLH